MAPVLRTGFTGTKRGMTEAQKDKVREILSELTGEFHHGDCVGADAQAHDIAVECGLEPVIHPPSNPAKRAWKPSLRIAEPLPYLDRNRVIVFETERLIAAPREFLEQVRSGTWSTIRYARLLEREIKIIYPDGSLKEE